MSRQSFPNVVIRASAGTGKTFQLSNRYIALALARAPLGTILATTFTRKAAGEILERIVHRLATAAIDADARDALAKFTAPDGAQTLTETQTRKLLREVLHELHRLRIGTLDAFFIQLARSFALELGLPPAWRVTDEIDDARLRLDAASRMLAEHPTEDVVRLMHLLSKGDVGRSVTDQILGIGAEMYGLFEDSSPDAWTKLAREKTLDDDAIDAAVGEIGRLELPSHKSFVKAVERSADDARAGDWDVFIEKGLAGKIAAGEATYYGKEITIDMERAFAPLIAHARAVVVNRLVAQNEATRQLLEHFASAYYAARRSGQDLRFDDVTRTLLRAGLLERLDDVVYRMDGDVHHLLLDEFQDTAPPQWRVLRPFAQRVTGEAGDRSFFCVGDVKQAIYGWRGGVAEIFDTVEQEVAGLSTAPLNTSFRSSPPVIETVNRVFESLDANAALGDHPSAAEQWTARFEPHSTARNELTGYCALIAAPSADHDADQEDEDGKRSKGPTKSEQKRETLDCAVRHILRIHEAIPHCSIGVLVRKNATVGRLIYLLRKAGVEASEEGGNPLTDSNAVNLLLSLLTVVEHPGDTAARFHVATSSLGPKVELRDHEDDAATWRLSEACRGELATRGYGDAIRRWAAMIVDDCDAREAARLDQFLELAYAYDARATDRIDDFLDFIRRQRVESPSSAKVRVMTVHQSKGLQFDVVVCPELEEALTGRTPRVVVGRESPAGAIDRVCRYANANVQSLLPPNIQRVFEETRQGVVEESLCVLYVALTRAVHGLLMITGPTPRKPPATSAGVLLDALARDVPPDAVGLLYEHGDADWMERLARKADAVPSTDDAPDVEALTIRLAPSGRSAPRGLERQTPSQLEGGFTIDLKHRLTSRNAAALDWGTAMHALFEQIDWLDDAPPADALLEQTARAILRSDADVERLLQAFREAIADPTIRSVLSRATYMSPSTSNDAAAVHVRPGMASPSLRAHRERPFVVMHDGGVLRGTIDRLVLLCDGDRVVAADVLDFKTDAVDADDPERLAECMGVYRPQLEAYRKAVAKLYGLKAADISTRLLFVGPKLVRSV